MLFIMLASTKAGTVLAAANRLSTVSRHLATTAAAPPRVNRVTVFGAGLMGSGIAQVAAQAGMKVVLTDVTEKALANGMDIISKSLPRVGKRQQPNDIDGFVKRALGNISTTVDRETAVADADVVIEAVVEKLKLKQDLFASLDRIAKPNTIFVSNTSSLLVADIASEVSEDRKTRFGGMHFFNPVPVMKLVEVIRTEKTSNETYDVLLDLAQRMGKVSVKAKDVPGFIVNRLLVPYKLEAVRMLERGEATAEDIDTAMKLGAGYPMGPFELYDYVGNDVTHFVSQAWVEYAKRGMIPYDLIKPSETLGALVARGDLGRKTGKGFFDWKDGRMVKKG